MQKADLQILHCLNEINLRNGWRDDDRFSIRLSGQIARGDFPEDQVQFLSRVQKTRTRFFKVNRVSKKHYSEYSWPYIAETLKTIRVIDTSQTEVVIASEETVFEITVDILRNYKEEIESTRLWQPFWNEENQKPRTPKEEPSLQPTIFSQLRPRFRQIGIEFLREPNDGAGPLDFRCTATHGTSALNCCIEFKRAQHGQLEHKLQTQLPAYMDAADTKYGILFVFWFKDGVNCKEPTKYSSPDTLRQNLLDAAKAVSPRVIEVIVVDVTSKPSASKR